MLPDIPIDWVAESTLATELGVPRDLLRSTRPTLAESEFALFGNVVAWKKTAARRVARTAFALEWPVEDAADKKTAPIIPERLVVTSAPRVASGHHFPNPRLIRARRATGEQVDVLVIDSSKYVPLTRDGKPMEFLAKPSATGAHWVLVGREPRWRGAW